MATISDIEAALLAPFQSVANGGTGEWVACPVALPNTDFDASKIAPTVPAYLRVYPRAGASSAITLGDEFTSRPTLVVEVNIRFGNGKELASALLDGVVALFQGQLRAAGDAKIRPYAVSSPIDLPADGWFRVGAQISFTCI